MPLCHQLPAVPAWLLTLLLAKLAFRRRSVRSGSWSLLHHEALRRRSWCPSLGTSLCWRGGHPLSSEGLEPQLHNTDCRFSVLEAVPIAMEGNIPSAPCVIQQCHAGASHIHTFRVLDVSHTRAQCMHTHRGRTANSRSREQWWTISIFLLPSSTYFSMHLTVRLRWLPSQQPMTPHTFALIPETAGDSMW